ncbi:hypothetical protein PHLGIDRAFT_104304 [Phlebiopsis gigantea 11061_1 CR5-6]|uniref:Aquaporin-like protein n=1 Tax=Phlebiopsis gigantea (strain 11061_1 CR5-6) TaxID=745531 RepID=A0A0C3S0P0_PHLG1|nr:hypothetical protein PHLGIDRAFT_104304 [Phlebiopsis gigantea 11061_1 CR5-6]
MSVLPRPTFVRLGDIRRRPRVLEQWEKVRHRQAHWLVECLAEAFGVFIYCYAGVGSQAGWVIGNLTAQPLGSIYQIGMAYAMGIILAMVTSGSTSGGHFSPAFTLVYVLFRGFPVLKGLRYVLAQCIGAYVACLVIYVQYRHVILEVEAGMAAKGVLDALLFTPSGPAGIFANFLTPGWAIGQVFVNEFVCTFIIATVLWAVLDPTNFFVTPVAAPVFVALSFGMCIWGYAPIGVSLNTARDLGGRFMALTIWGTGAAGGRYAAVSALTNLLATVLAALFYELVLTDSRRVVVPSGVEFLTGHNAHAHDADDGAPPPAPSNGSETSIEGKA